MEKAVVVLVDAGSSGRAV